MKHFSNNQFYIFINKEITQCTTYHPKWKLRDGQSYFFVRVRVFLSAKMKVMNTISHMISMDYYILAIAS